MREKSIEHWEAMRQSFLDNIDNAVEMMQELIRQTNELEDKVKELEDASEFEARVAAWLATMMSLGVKIQTSRDIIEKNNKPAPAWMILRLAHRAVESDMEQEGK